MRNKDILRELGEVDEKYIMESDPTAPIAVNKKKRRLRALAVIAACVSVMILSASLWLFVPYSVELPESLLEQSESEYYDIWLKMYMFQESQNDQPKNNYEKYLKPIVFEYFYTMHEEERLYPNYAGDFTVSDSSFDGNHSSYVEVTDNQFSGIIEPDNFKRTNTHIYYLDSDGVIYCYSIKGDKSELCGAYDLFENKKSLSDYAIGFFLTEDGNSLIVITRRKQLAIVLIDVSDPSNMKESKRIEIGSGSYKSARINDGKLIFAYRQFIDFVSTDGYESALPSDITVKYSDADIETVKFERRDIAVPDAVDEMSYLVMLQIDIESFKIEEKFALLSESEVLTITEDYIVVNYQHTEKKDKIIETYPCAVYFTKTRLSVITYGTEGFDYRGSKDFDGSVSNRYAVDVSDGVLRVVTTSGTTVYNEINITRSVENISCNLWCYDLNIGRMVASVKNFAPEGEDVKSVRFEGDTAYVCTAKLVGGIYSDPVYYFDLSDYKNIKSIDTGAIEGYSAMLKPFGDGILLGIGIGQDSKGNNSMLKVEVYADKGDRVESICSYEREFVSFSRSYHSYLFDTENGYIGIAFYDWVRNDQATDYILFHFDGDNLVTVVEERFENTRNKGDLRSVIIDGYLYIMIADEFRVVKLPE